MTCRMTRKLSTAMINGVTMSRCHGRRHSTRYSRYRSIRHGAHLVDGARVDSARVDGVHVDGAYLVVYIT